MTEIVLWQYVLLCVVGAGVYVLGLLLRALTHEEMKDGRRYFQGVKRIWVVVLALGIVWSLWTALGFMSLVCCALFVLGYVLWRDAWVFWFIPLAFWLNPTFGFLCSLYGLLWGATVEYNSKRSLLTAYLTLRPWMYVASFLLVLLASYMSLSVFGL